MNWLLIIVLIGMAFCIWRGYQKGFLRMLLSLVSIIVVVMFVTITTPYISDYIENHTSLGKKIEEQCLEHIKLTAEDKIDKEAEDKQKVLEEAGISLPSGIWEDILSSGTDVADQVMEETGVYETLAQTTAHFVVSGISFFVALTIATILMIILTRTLNLVAKLPIIKQANHFLGIMAGFAQGMILLWLFFYLVAVTCTSEFGLMMIDYIHQSVLLTYLYNNNLVLYLCLNMF